MKFNFFSKSEFLFGKIFQEIFKRDTFWYGSHYATLLGLAIRLLISFAISSSSIVITSYSIHYTKLYDTEIGIFVFL